MSESLRGKPTPGGRRADQETNLLRAYFPANPGTLQHVAQVSSIYVDGVQMYRAGAGNAKYTAGWSLLTTTY